MAVAFRSSTSTTYASRASTVLTAPAGLADNDILIASVFCGRATPATQATPPAGFTEIGTVIAHADGGFLSNWRIFWKRAASESGSYTFTHTTASTQGFLAAYSGCITTGSPVDANSQNTGTGSPHTTTATGITTTVANTMLLFLTHDWTGSGALSPPSGMTERFDSLLYAADVIQAAAGATGNKSHANGNVNSTDDWAARLVALKEAAGGAFEIDADGGSYAITGTAASLERGREVAADGGSYAISGTAASLELGREVLAGGGSYALTGTDATFDRTYVLTALGGSYSISGTAASLELGREVAADSGTYAITGTAASLELGREVASDGGTYALTGTAASLELGREVAANGGSYAITGADVTLTKSVASTFSITADGGSYSITGTAATISRTYAVAADTASYSISGSAATLALNQEPVEEPRREVNWPFASIYRRRREEEYKRLTAAEKKELVIEARKRVIEVIVLGEATTAKAAIEEVREDIAPAVPAKDWAAIAQRIEASARRAILRKQEEEDEEDDILLLLH